MPTPQHDAIVARRLDHGERGLAGAQRMILLWRVGTPKITISPSPMLRMIVP